MQQETPARGRTVGMIRAGITHGKPPVDVLIVLSVPYRYERKSRPDVGETARSALHCPLNASTLMKLHRVLTGLLILLLLYAQQAAYAHAISHLGKEPPAKEQLAHSKLCDKCVSFEKIAGVAAANAPALLPLEFLFTQQPRAGYAFNPRTVAAFHSRAPPIFL